MMPHVHMPYGVICHKSVGDQISCIYIIIFVSKLGAVGCAAGAGKERMDGAVRGTQSDQFSAVVTQKSKK